MSVKIKVVTKRNPQDLSAPAKYHGVAVSRGSRDLNDLAELITGQSSMTQADVYGVLIALEHNIIQQLEQGRSVHLGRIGSFQVGVSTSGTETREKFSIRQITKRRIIFRPGNAFKTMLRGLSFSVR